MNGIICIDKPQGFTSFDVVAKLRGILKMRQIGHGGTLDPMATGVLPVFLGKATRACDMLESETKCYEAALRFGMTTDTLDITGNVLSQNESFADIDALENVLDEFRGDIMQTPPMYSAITVNGQRLYKLARKGITVERKARPVKVFSLELTGFDEKEQCASIRVKCSKGTYIRTLIDDIGGKLGCGAVMTALRRTESGGFTLESCVGFDDVKKLVDEKCLEKILFPVERLFEGLEKITLDEKQERHYRNGVRLSLSRMGFESDGRFSVYTQNGIFLGTACADTENDSLVIEKNFA